MTYTAQMETQAPCLRYRFRFFTQVLFQQLLSDYTDRRSSHLDLDQFINSFFFPLLLLGIWK